MLRKRRLFCHFPLDIQPIVNSTTTVERTELSAAKPAAIDAPNRIAPVPFMIRPLSTIFLQVAA